MANTKIEWADAVWNPVTGCTKISPGCQNCYAERMAQRLRGRCGYPKEKPFQVTLHPERLNEPLKWKKPRRVFVCSMGDLFHQDVDPYDIMQIFNVMAKAKHHTFMVLTKRPERMLEVYKRLRSGTTIPGPYFSITGKGEGWAGSPPSLPDNIWLGVTAENQEQADMRISILLQIPAAVRFVSCEPLLGPINLMEVIDENGDSLDVLNGWGRAVGGYDGPITTINWVVIGGETGPNARPMHPDWVRSLSYQCQAAGVPFFFKQWGEWQSFYDRDKDDPDWRNIPREKPGICRLNLAGGCGFHGERVMYFRRVGKKTAGRLLDGSEWSEFPELN